MSIRRSLFVAAMLSLLAACGEASTQDSTATVASATDVTDELLNTPTVSAVGKVDGTDAYIAVVDGGDELTVYICDSAQVALWFTAKRVGADFAGEHRSGATVSVRATAKGFDGSVVIDGATHAFAASTAVYPSGLWEGFDRFSADEPIDVDKIGRFGWIVLADGTQRGAKTTVETTTAAGTVDPATGSGDGGQVPASPTPPPPTPLGLTAKQCKSLKTQYAAYDAAFQAEEDAAKASKLYDILVNTATYFRNNCTGSIYS